MAITIDATVGGAASNSYSTLAEANAYHASRINSEAWSNLDNDPKSQALIQATQLLDMQVTWLGWPASSTQALAWPRSGAYNKNGVYIQSNVIPVNVKWATAELALYLLTTQAASAEAVPAGLKALTAGSVKLEFDPNLTATESIYVLPDHVWSMVAHLATYGGSSGISVPLVRY